MGANAWATEEGRFVILVTRYSDGKKLGELVITGLEPREGVDYEFVESLDSPCED